MWSPECTVCVCARVTFGQEPKDKEGIIGRREEEQNSVKQSRRYNDERPNGMFTDASKAVNRMQHRIMKD